MELHGTVFICTPKACNFCNNGCSRIVWAIYTWEDNCRLVCKWWWCCNAFPVVGEASQWPFSTLSWGPCTDLNGWFNLNLATVTRLLAGIKLWTLFVVCIVKCFCMLCFSPPGTFPLACTLCLYGAGMPIHLHSAPHFKVGVQCTGAVVIYIIECLVTTSDLAKCFLLKFILQCSKAL